MFFESVDFSSLELPATALKLREEVGAFLRAEIAAGSFTPHLGHTEFDAGFTRKLASRGWIGMTWPRRYGGQERSYLERFVVTEETLAAAAPCAAHWFGDRHQGLWQLIVELDAPGVTIRPIRFMNGHHHFNEVFLDNVFVPDDMVVGEIGQGWKQVTSELALERSGPERFLTTFPLLVATEPDPEALDRFERYLAETVVCAPISTIRGGTTQVLRTLIARWLLGPLK